MITRAMLAASVMMAGIVTGTVALAADKDGNFAIRGVGRISCAELTNALQNKDQQRLSFFGTWLEGYITAANQFSENTFDSTPWQTTELMLALLGRGCAQTPDKNFMGVVGRLIADMRPLRLTQNSPILKLQTEDNVQTHYREIVERVRARLIELGYAFEVDGIIGKKALDELRANISAYQKAANLPPTGNLDQHTMLNLFVVPDKSE